MLKITKTSIKHLASLQQACCIFFQSLEAALRKITEANNTLNSALKIAREHVPENEVSGLNNNILDVQMNLAIILHLYLELFCQFCGQIY